jgi:hypothetical protein
MTLGKGHMHEQPKERRLGAIYKIKSRSRSFADAVEGGERWQRSGRVRVGSKEDLRAWLRSEVGLERWQCSGMFQPRVLRDEREREGERERVSRME